MQKTGKQCKSKKILGDQTFRYCEVLLHIFVLIKTRLLETTKMEIRRNHAFVSRLVQCIVPRLMISIKKIAMMLQTVYVFLDVKVLLSL